MTSPSGRPRATSRPAARDHLTYSSNQHLHPRGRAGAGGQRRRDREDRLATRGLGDYVVLRDAYGNSFTYAELGEVSKVHPVADHGDDKGGSAPEDEDGEAPKDAGKGKAGDEAEAPEPENTEDIRERIAAFPDRRGVTPRRSSPPAACEVERTDAFAVYERLSATGCSASTRTR